MPAGILLTHRSQEKPDAISQTPFSISRNTELQSISILYSCSLYTTQVSLVFFLLNHQPPHDLVPHPRPCLGPWNYNMQHSDIFPVCSIEYFCHSLCISKCDEQSLLWERKSILCKFIFLPGCKSDRGSHYSTQRACDWIHDTEISPVSVCFIKHIVSIMKNIISIKQD